MHHILEIMFIHLAVPNNHSGLWTEFAEPVGNFLDRGDTIVEKVHLPLPAQFAVDRVANDPLVIRADERLDRDAIRRRRLDGAHVLRPHEREIKRARDRSGRERQHVDQPEQLLELLLVKHTEALLFVDDDQAEVSELDVF
jgi:hypothetical protein